MKEFKDCFFVRDPKIWLDEEFQEALFDMQMDETEEENEEEEVLSVNDEDYEAVHDIAIAKELQN